MNVQTIQIAIEQCDGYAHCEVPLLGPVYGNTVEELAMTLDELQSTGYFENIFKLQIDSKSE